MDGMQEIMYLQYKEFCQPLVLLVIYVTIPSAGFRTQTTPIIRSDLLSGSPDHQFFHLLFRKTFFDTIVVIWCIGHDCFDLIL